MNVTKFNCMQKWYLVIGKPSANPPMNAKEILYFRTTIKLHPNHHPNETKTNTNAPWGNRGVVCTVRIYYEK